MTRLDGKVAIITGGASGMGASHVELFVKEGAKVVFTDINEEGGKSLENKIGKNVKFVKHDVSNASDWKNVVEVTNATFGPVNVLVNNAGITIPKNIEEMTEDDYKKVININQISVFLGMKSVLPTMKTISEGSIVNISSISGFVGGLGNIAYDASKFAIRGMTKTAAVEFGKYGIRVNSVHPGVIETPMTQGPEYEDAIKVLKTVIPLQRIAKPEEVSNLVLFLASDESSYSTGSEFVTDGGFIAQ